MSSFDIITPTHLLANQRVESVHFVGDRHRVGAPAVFLDEERVADTVRDQTADDGVKGGKGRRLPLRFRLEENEPIWNLLVTA